jgi:hypothetical protein
MFQGKEPRGFDPTQARWLRENNADLAQEFVAAVDFIALKYRHVAPGNTFAGQIVLADGVNWNPGAGAGMYRRNEANAAWVFVG